MFDEQQSHHGDYSRHETDAERLDRNFGELLQELRVAQAGVQILFGFLLSLAFQARFVALDTFELDVYLVTLLAAALAVTFFTGPVAAHRLLFRRGVKGFLVKYTARMAEFGLGFLAVAVVGGVVLVTDVLLNRGAALGIGAGLVLVGVVIWLLVPISMRKKGHRPEQI
ncbi:MAG: DUF6328 family protein [Actinomycetota bacterium]|nr:DUF6328 family protein [Actinomycetota bacterium]